MVLKHIFSGPSYPHVLELCHLKWYWNNYGFVKYSKWVLELCHLKWYWNWKRYLIENVMVLELCHLKWYWNGGTCTVQYNGVLELCHLKWYWNYNVLFWFSSKEKELLSSSFIPFVFSWCNLSVVSLVCSIFWKSISSDISLDFPPNILYICSAIFSTAFCLWFNIFHLY